MEQEPRNRNYWSLEVNQSLELLETSPDGLSSTEAQRRTSLYGENVLHTKKSNGPLQIIFDQLQSPLIFILVLAAVVTGYLHEYIETVVIGLAVLVNVALGFYQEFKAENTIEQLRSYIRNRATVLRDGEFRDVDARELVIGDIVDVSYGNRVPADGRLLDTTNLQTDEAILTGESISTEKSTDIVTSDKITDRHNYLYCGTFVTQGTGRMVVTATGNATEIGTIALSVSRTKRASTPVQNAVAQMSWYIFALAVLIIVLIFFLGVSRGEGLLDMLILSAAVAVGAVPEALPITLTIILSVGVLNISKKGGLIRKLSAAETLGSTTLILTDKTGTLTQAALTLEAIYNKQELVSSESLHEKKLTEPDKMQRHIITQAYANTQALVEKVTTDPKSWKYTGGAIDVIILKSIHQFNIEIPTHTQSKLLVPFDSSNKYSISSDGTDLWILGAPDVLIASSNLTDEQKSQALENTTNTSNQGKRLVALGKKTKHSGHTLDISDMEITALFAFSDPIRPEVPDAIADIQSKGVQVKIITGDILGTARAIAHQAGITVADDEILTGEQVKGLSDADLSALLPRIKLFVRTTPTDKQRIGELYRKLGEVVAMTGDGVNDSPALKAMDIGISLGSASDVAKSAADMILLDNNFKTITDTITEGYRIRSNIQKVFAYLVSNSLDEVFVIAGALLLGLALPLNALQIIWVNLLTGTFPALAFAYDKNYSVARSKKHNKIFNTRTKILSLGIGMASSLLLVLLYWALNVYIVDIAVVRSVFFTCFATYVLSVSYSFHDLHKSIFAANPFKNLRLNIANGIGLLLIIATVTLPVFERIFEMSALPLHYIWIVVAWNVFNVAFLELAKHTINRFKIG